MCLPQSFLKLQLFTNYIIDDMLLKNMLVFRYTFRARCSISGTHRALQQKQFPVLAASWLLSGLLLVLPGSVFAQSGDGDAPDDQQALIEQLEEQLEEQKKELEAAIAQRDATRDEQDEIRELLAAESEVQDEKAQKLLELCQKYNSANSGAVIDCEKELGE